MKDQRGGGAHCGNDWFEQLPATGVAPRAGDPLKPDDAKVWYNLAVSYAAHGQHAEAVSAYREAITANPDFPEAWYNLGVALGNQGQYAKAIEAFRQAMRLRPGYVNAWFNFGVAAAIEGDQGGVVEAYEQLKALDAAKAEEFFTAVVGPE